LVVFYPPDILCCHCMKSAESNGRINFRYN
jgi:hypothetical protein